ncbi:3-hydroxyacyl-CoA dehydrogenase [Xanthobacter sp. VNH20]|uniref:3-hydroxyacyl-CoA dehydrogenase n=1 Tax=Xanthobacter sp. VNH20 TaxID=3156616 RepID=UPI0032B4E391
MSALAPSALVAVVGAGTMGAGIAQIAARAGHDVLIFDAKPGAAEKGRSGILAALSKQVAKGRLSEQQYAEMATRLRVASVFAALKDAALVVEAVVEDLEVKKGLFRELEGIVGDDAILATNTSALSVTAICAGLKRPGRVAGLHFFNPVPLMALVEVVAGLASECGTLETLFDTATAWGKMPVHAKSTPGFIVNRVARPFYAEGLRLLEEGAADVPTIDAIMREAGGFRMGPFELMDLIGHDVNFAVTSSTFQAYFNDPRYRPAHTQQDLVAAGWLGRKSGRGFYDYADGAVHPEPNTRAVCRAPRRVEVSGPLGPAESLVPALVQAGIEVERRNSDGEGRILMEGATLALTDGRTATARVAAGGPDDLVLFDLALDYAKASRIALAPADQAAPGAADAAASLFQALGKAVSVVDDAPGLIVMRTLAMLANEAAEASLQGVATPSDIDRAMMLGVNYPAGPLAWADLVGTTRILRVLQALQDVYGDDRYRASSLLRRCVAGGRSVCCHVRQ